ncbi:MAG: MFS transporter [Dehalococcoidia bacterium]
MAVEETPTTTAPHGDARAPRTHIYAALAHRDFRLLLAGNVATQLGQWTQQVGKGWLVYTLTQSTLQLGLVSFFMGLGMLLGAPVGGALADRFNRRKVILASQTALVIIALFLAFLVLTDAIRIWHIYILALLSGGGFATNGPSRQSLVHDLVGKRDLPNAIALNTVSMNSMRIIGPSIGGIMIGTVGIEGTFFVQAGGYVVAMILVLMMRTTPPPSDAIHDPMLQSMAAGARYARRDRTIALLLTIGFVSGFLGMAYMQLLPAYVGDVLKQDKGSVLGYLMTAGGIGGLLGALGVTLLGNFRWKGRLLVAAVATTGLLQLLLGGFSTLMVAIPVLAGLGAAGAITLTMTNTLLQTNVDDQYRGRVMSLYFMLSFSLAPLGVLFGGAIAESVGLQPTIMVLGALVIAAMAWIVISSPRIRRL